ncbi:YicC family protein [Cryomorphaceae bacterium]|nr:YicC family protein [Cryomorphaceae bacterium]
MVLSMTGFGKASNRFGNKKITVEIRSLNSKGIDINTRLPQVYREKDLELRNRASGELVRGKVDLSVFVESEGADSGHQLNAELIKSYYGQLKALADELGDSSDLMTAVLRFPEVLQSEREELSEDEWRALEETLKEAMVRLTEHRAEEGRAMDQDLRGNVAFIEEQLMAIEPLETERKEAVRERLRKNLDDLKEKVDENRFEQELIYYLEKFDINEEKVRLRKHCSYFLSILNEEKSQGKKLGFIAQEMGREINTIGSKANHAGIQKHVVQMKDVLEQIKELVLNCL